MLLERSAKKRTIRYRWAVFGILAIAYFFVYFHRVSTAVVSADLVSTFAVDAASIALLSSAYFYAYTVMQLPSGLLTDSLGPRKTVSLFTLIAAGGAILTGIASTFDQVIAGRLLIGIGVAMVYIPTMKILAFCFGFFGGFFVVSFAQIKELFPISIVGTSTAALNIFPFAGGAVLQQLSGLLLATRDPESYQNLWLFMLICMAAAAVAAFLSQEKDIVKI